MGTDDTMMLLDALEDDALAAQRMEGFDRKTLLSQEEVDEIFGFDAGQLDALDDIEIEFE